MNNQLEYDLIAKLNQLREQTNQEQPMDEFDNSFDNFNRMTLKIKEWWNGKPPLTEKQIERNKRAAEWDLKCKANPELLKKVFIADSVNKDHIGKSYSFDEFSNLKYK